MTLQECYAAMGGNYEEVLGRLRSDRLIQKFVLKFVDDGSYQLLLDSMASQNYEDAFRAAHTIKGVCQNLGFTGLYMASETLTEMLRSHPEDYVPSMLDDLKAEYEKTYAAVEKLKAE